MSDEVMREVDELLKDRDKYEAWLNKLESQKPGTSEGAYAKVREDYRRRLDEVTQKLGSHSASVREKLAALEGQVEALESERASRTEKLDEARLRRSVGEYGDDNQWQKLEADLLGSVQEAERQVESLKAEIGRLQEIVSLAEGAGAAPGPTPQPKPAAVAPEPELEPLVETEPEPEPVAEPEPAREPVAAAEPEVDDGLISLEELVLSDEEVDEGEVGVEAAETEDTAAKPAAAGEGGGGVGDELAFLESLSLSGTEETESFTFLEQSATGTPQTIICPHCSAANDPAEWYCTECGEELPAE